DAPLNSPKWHQQLQRRWLASTPGHRWRRSSTGQTFSYLDKEQVVDPNRHRRSSSCGLSRLHPAKRHIGTTRILVIQKANCQSKGLQEMKHKDPHEEHRKQEGERQSRTGNRESPWLLSLHLFTRPEKRSSTKTLDKQLAETYWSETTGAGTATTAMRLMFRRSRILKLTQLRVQSATNKRPKARVRW
ncbi:hypothetical protein IGI04_020011, partial [Brassica rapa subsp. trilocularis]